MEGERIEKARGEKKEEGGRRRQNDRDRKTYLCTARRESERKRKTERDKSLSQMTNLR